MAPGEAGKKRKAASKSGSEWVSYAPSHEQIAVRAYFIAEHRLVIGQHGDAEGDWHEAERQLRAEWEAIEARLSAD